MKTLNDLQALIFDAIRLESNNNFLIKYSVWFNIEPNGLLSFSVKYNLSDKTYDKKIDFLFNPEKITVNEIQAYYWQLNLFLERHYK